MYRFATITLKSCTFMLLTHNIMFKSYIISWYVWSFICYGWLQTIIAISSFYISYIFIFVKILSAKVTWMLLWNFFEQSFLEFLLFTWLVKLQNCKNFSLSRVHAEGSWTEQLWVIGYLPSSRSSMQCMFPGEILLDLDSSLLWG